MASSTTRIPAKGSWLSSAAIFHQAAAVRLVLVDERQADDNIAPTGFLLLKFVLPSLNNCFLFVRP